MDPMTLGLLIGGGTGLLKGMSDAEAAKHQRKVEAEVARWSPWTGMKPERVGAVNVLNPVMQGAFLGAMMGNQFPAGEAEAAAGETAAATTSPTGPYQTEAEYSQNIKPMGLPPTTPEYGWLPENAPASAGQYPLGYPTTQDPGVIQPMSPMQSPWPVMGPQRM